MKLFVAGLSYETAPFELREQVASRRGTGAGTAAGLETPPLPSVIGENVNN